VLLGFLGGLEPILSTVPLVMGRRSVAGSVIGGIPETQEMLDFCGKHSITSDVEVIKIQDINEAYERMLKSDVKYRFVPRGSKVLVKSNIGWDVTPDRAGDTHPKLVARIIEHCLNAGAKEVSVFDHTCENWVQCYKNSGIEKAVKDASGVSSSTREFISWGLPVLLSSRRKLSRASRRRFP
jgi:hypothetical protein